MLKHALVIHLLFIPLLFVPPFIIESVSASSSGSDTSCEAEDILRSVQRAFRKIIPEYYSDIVAIQLNTNTQLTFNPTDPVINSFLLNFLDTATKVIDDRESSRPLIKLSMRMVLNYEYSQFLFVYGRPLSCLTYLLGTVDDYSIISTIYKKSLGSQKYFQEKINFKKKNQESSFSPLRGKEIIKRLDLVSDIVGGDEGLKDQSTRQEKSCSEYIVESKGGGILAKYPTINLLPHRIRIPGQSGIIDTYNNNITYLLEDYYKTVLSCSEGENLKSGFATSFAIWISDKLLPALLKASTCSPGFHRILPLLVAVDSYGLDKKEASFLTNDTFMNTTTEHGGAVAASASATIFLIFFAFLLPIFFLLYYVYLREGSIEGVRIWMAKNFNLTDHHHRHSRDSLDKSGVSKYFDIPPEVETRAGVIDESSLTVTEKEPKQSIETQTANWRAESVDSATSGDEKTPLFPKKTTEKPPRKFRNNSRDIYIQMAEYPLDISIEERESEDETPSMSDELSITTKRCNSVQRNQGKLPVGKLQRTNPRQNQKKEGNSKKIRLKPPVQTRKYDDDEEEEEEIFYDTTNGAKNKNRTIYDFTDPRRVQKQAQRQNIY